MISASTSAAKRLVSKLPKPWQRCTAARGCPVCHAAGCLYAGPPADPTAIVCAQVESSERIGTRGWLHVLDDRGPIWSPWRCSLARLAGGGRR